MPGGARGRGSEMTANAPSDQIQIATLALRPRDAARALEIGERLLWSKTNDGEIPCVRIGRAGVYPVNLLREYLDRLVQDELPASTIQI